MNHTYALYQQVSPLTTSTSSVSSTSSTSLDTNANIAITSPNPVTTTQDNNDQNKKKKDTFSSKLVDYFVDHPWHFFGPLFGLLLFYVIRSSISTDNQDSLVKYIDELLLLHAREITTIGRANTLTRAEWEDIVNKTFQMIEEIIDSQIKNSEERRISTIENKLSLLQIRPSELQYIIEQSTGKPLKYSYMLQRAAIGLALLRDDQLKIPQMK